MQKRNEMNGKEEKHREGSCLDKPRRPAVPFFA